MVTNIYAFSLQFEIRNCCFVQSNGYDRRLSIVNEQECSSINTLRTGDAHFRFYITIVQDG